MKDMIEAFKERTIDSAIKGFIIEQNDEITNEVRAQLEKYSKEELIEVRDFLNRILNYCYDGSLYKLELDADYKKIKELNEKEKFLLKETAIYFLGRLPIECDLDILKKAYDIDDDKYIKLNITFASLQSFDETIELDFVDKVLSNDEYDLMIRSWTMAFFKKENDPYNYKDKETDDWTPAKNPRINRLKINEESNPKFLKAMSFRLLDLVVLYLFVRNRKNNSLTEEEKQIIKDANIKYKKYSDNKKDLMKRIKKMILDI